MKSLLSFSFISPSIYSSLRWNQLRKRFAGASILVVGGDKGIDIIDCKVHHLPLTLGSDEQAPYGTTNRMFFICPPLNYTKRWPYNVVPGHRAELGQLSSLDFSKKRLLVNLQGWDSALHGLQ